MAMIRDNLLTLRERISAACVGAKRDPATITLVAVSKTRTVEEIREALEAGVTDIGENRLQEALIKYPALASERTVKWHMVGHLQTNKAKEAVGIFDLIHSVDSLRLAQEIDRQAAYIKKSQDILVEVNVSGESTKFGVRSEDLSALIKEISGLSQVRVLGLMTVVPITDNPEKVRPYFRQLRELKDEINPLTNNQLTILSMGMSDDFEVALEEGANIVRLGRAIFEG